MADDDRITKAQILSFLKTVITVGGNGGTILKGILALSVITVPIGAVFGIATVDPGERGVYVRNGDVRGVVNNGVHPIIPLTDRIRIFDMRQTTSTRNADALTNDNINVNITVTVRWNIKEDRLLYVYEEVAVNQEELIQKAVNDAIISGIKTSRGFNSDNLSTVAYRDAVAGRINDLFEERGLILVSVTIEDINYPPSVAEKFRRQKESQAQRQIEENKLEAQEVRNRRNIAQAEAEAKAIRIKRESLSPTYIRFVEAQNIDESDTVYIVPRSDSLPLEKSVEPNGVSGNETATG